MINLILDLYQKKMNKLNFRKLKEIRPRIYIAYLSLIISGIWFYLQSFIGDIKAIRNIIPLIILILSGVLLERFVRIEELEQLDQRIENYKHRLMIFVNVLKDELCITSTSQYELLIKTMKEELSYMKRFPDKIKPFISFFSIVLIPICTYIYSLLIREEYIANNEIQIIILIVLMIIFLFGTGLILYPIVSSFIDKQYNRISNVIRILEDIMILELINNSHESVS